MKWYETGNIKPLELFQGPFLCFKMVGSTFHGLRHIHASLLLAEGVDPKAISERLGHSKVSLTLDIYAHLLPGLQESAAVALDRRLSHVHGFC
jgi:integrase